MDSLEPYSTMEEMHEDIIEKHNSVVKPSEKVYFLGDCVVDKAYFDLLGRFNGHLRLIKGNHCVEHKSLNYYKYFEQLLGVKFISDKKVILTHIPIHPDSILPGWINIVGHLHCNPVPDERYKCVCLEQINFTPISLDELLSK